MKPPTPSPREQDQPTVAQQKSDPASLETFSKEEFLALVEKAFGSNGITISFAGRTNASRIARRVRPRVTRRIKSLSVGSAESQASNLLIEGDNLQAMATLYRERGQVDLILTDPPYNTGNDFRYNDRWEEDPNDPGLGELVRADDGARHTKWMRFMLPRLQMMRSMLKLGGVLAICIDHRELFRLGQMLDELFGEENRLAIINWQKSAAPRPDNEHVSTATEYVLVYAKEKEQAKTGLLPRDNQRYSNPDNDPKKDWREGNLTARSWVAKDYYAIQSPFTGEIHYPAGEGAWRHPKRNIKQWLEEWGTEYIEQDIDDGNAKALMVKGGIQGKVPAKASKAAQHKLATGPWPFIWFGRDGQGRPRTKTYLADVKQGRVPITWWADDDYSSPLQLDSTSWPYSESGRSSGLSAK
jgi:adenine-specific DNA-methyltransferase